MPTKEFGSIFVAICPLCQDQLIAGWDADQDVTPAVDLDRPGVREEFAKRNPSFGTFQPLARRVKGAADIQRMIAGPLTCSCANAVTLRYRPLLGRCEVSWISAEPVTGNINHHPPSVP